MGLEFIRGGKVKPHLLLDLNCEWHKLIDRYVINASQTGFQYLRKEYKIVILFTFKFHLPLILFQPIIQWFRFNKSAFSVVIN